MAILHKQKSNIRINISRVEFKGTLYSMVAGLGFRYTNCTVNLIEQ